MKIIHVVCEGQTEANFVKNVLSVNFLERGIYFNPIIVITKTDNKTGRLHKGGISSFSKIKRTLEGTLSLIKNENTFVTTMFDYYHMPTDTPGFSQASKKKNPYEKVEVIEEQILTTYQNYKNKFIPYLQLHEFETLIFTNLDKLSEKYFEYDIKKLINCLDKIKNPELINNSEQTAPSKRIIECIPCYDKVHMGVEILKETDFEEIRKKCRHFNEWITKLESI